MKIDRHNYEEFFLLYVDNELSAEQKKSVDQFIQENADLANELEILQQLTLKADDAIVFEGKELLLKKENDSFINMTNYEEYLISYIDNELNTGERNEFEKFVALHPQVKEELAIFRQTKLHPEEEIVFTNKEVLYRREEKVRVVTMQWWKIAVAAAIILVISITTITILNKPASVSQKVANNTKQNTEKNNPAIKTEQDIKKEQQDSPVEIKNSSDAVASTKINNTKSIVAPVQKGNEERIQKKIIVPVLNKNNNESIVKKDIPVKNNNAITDNNNNDVINKKSDEPVATNDVAINNNLLKQNINNKIVTKNPEVSSDIQIEPDAVDTKGTLASYDEGKNKKLRGFFRKAARVFERRTNISASDEDNNDKVLIGALAVKLK